MHQNGAHTGSQGPEGVSNLSTIQQPPLAQECIARRLSSTTFVEAVLKEIELFRKLRNPTAAAAALAEADAYLNFLDAMDDLGNIVPSRQDPARPPTSEFTLVNGLNTLRAAKENLAKADWPGRDTIAGIQDLGEDPRTALPATTSAIMAQCAVMSFHIKALKDAKEDTVEESAIGEGHQLAAKATGLTITDLTGFLITNIGTLPTIPEDTIDRAIRASQETVTLARTAEHEIRHFTPILYHESVRENPELLDRAWTSAKELLHADENLMVDGATASLDINNCLLLMYYDQAVYVHTPPAEYPEGTPWEFPLKHAAGILNLAAEHPDKDAAELIRRTAEVLTAKTLLDIHTVHPETLKGTISELAKLCKDPHALRQATMAVLIPNYATNQQLHDQVAGYYLDQSPHPALTMGEDGQVKQVLQAARDAGIKEAPLRSLCKFLGLDPEQEGIPSNNKTTWEEIQPLMAEATAANQDRTALTEILNIVGHDPESPEATRWLSLHANPSPTMETLYQGYED